MRVMRCSTGYPKTFFTMFSSGSAVIHFDNLRSFVFIIRGGHGGNKALYGASCTSYGPRAIIFGRFVQLCIICILISASEVPMTILNFGNVGDVDKPLLDLNRFNIFVLERKMMLNKEHKLYLRRRACFW